MSVTPVSCSCVEKHIGIAQVPEEVNGENKIVIDTFTYNKESSHSSPAKHINTHSWHRLVPQYALLVVNYIIRFIV